jgi:peroxiredoxin
MALQKGDKAPSFKLFNSDKKEVSLSDFNGKNLIVHFFPQAFTGVCYRILTKTFQQHTELFTKFFLLLE